MSEPFHQTARLITAQLLPHTISVQNVTLIAEALERARMDALSEAADACTQVSNAYEAWTNIQALRDKDAS